MTTPRTTQDVPCSASAAACRNSASGMGSVTPLRPPLPLPLGQKQNPTCCSFWKRGRVMLDFLFCRSNLYCRLWHLTQMDSLGLEGKCLGTLGCPWSCWNRMSSAYRSSHEAACESQTKLSARSAASRSAVSVLVEALLELYLSLYW